MPCGVSAQKVFSVGSLVLHVDIFVHLVGDSAILNDS